jgi:hypothetical protein
VEKAPGENARWIVEDEVPGDQEEESGNDQAIQARRRRPGDARGRRPYFSPGGRGSTRAPHEQTMLRVAHWMFNSRPHLPQPR